VCVFDNTRAQPCTQSCTVVMIKDKATFKAIKLYNSNDHHEKQTPYKEVKYSLLVEVKVVPFH